MCYSALDIKDSCCPLSYIQGTSPLRDFPFRISHSNSFPELRLCLHFLVYHGIICSFAFSDKTGPHNERNFSIKTVNDPILRYIIAFNFEEPTYQPSNRTEIVDNLKDRNTTPDRYRIHFIYFPFRNVSD